MVCKPKAICPPTVLVSNYFDEEVTYYLNEYEFIDLRVKIKQNKEEGWYWIEYRNEKPIEHLIDQEGRMEYHPPQFELMGNMLVKLF